MRKGISPDLIARVLGGAPKYTIAELEEKFPVRNLPDGAMVTRIAPSPTGFFHTGNLYPNIIDKKLASQSGGVYMLRVEDTDTKREVPGAVDVIVGALSKFGLNIDEGMIGDDREIGAYGPYTQSRRKEIYHSVAAELLATGRAYPCFLAPEEMDEIRKVQSAEGLRTGIYGSFARDRNLTEDEIAARMDAGGVPSIRLYSTGDYNRKIYCKEGIRGSVAFPENDEDIVIIKSNDGLPTYHFAMLCDDHFMRITHVVRGTEWLPSLPLHVQLYNMMSWTPPIFIHNATIDILDDETGNRRKLSKRKDRVAAVSNLWADGWAPESVLEYVFNLIVSGYEEAKMKNPALTIWDYPVNIKKLSVSGALFDMKKMEWWAREFIASLDESKYEITDRVTNWASEFDADWYARIQGRREYLHNILNIERDNPKRIRKDFVTWKQTLDEIAYFFDDVFVGANENSPTDATDSRANFHSPLHSDILSEFLGTFDSADSKDLWWNKITEIAARFGIKNGDAAMALRVALTGRTNTPDLYSIMQVMGEERVIKRIKNAAT
ncbi:MAG: glutamate--tRNA ligase family protein [Alphaproteobacteria bacterium]|nr:glutamate--tRNA ligase family protein [Alphaproteobacteria bacterium]